MSLLHRNIVLWGLLPALVFTVLSCSEPQKQPYGLTELSYKLQVVDSLAGTDPDASQLIRPYRDSIQNSMGKVIGYSEIVMTKGTPESTLGNFVSDLILETCRIKHFDVDFSMTNLGGFRSILPKGEITLGRVYELMPFDNIVVILKMNPLVMTEFLDYLHHGEALAVSGIEIDISPEKTTVRRINGMPYDSTKTYLMATNDYLAGGGSNMDFLKGNQVESTGILLRDMIISYIGKKYENGEKINAFTDGRVTVVK